MGVIGLMISGNFICLWKFIGEAELYLCKQILCYPLYEKTGNSTKKQRKV